MTTSFDVSIKSGVRSLVRSFVRAAGATRVGRFTYDRIVDEVVARTQTLSHHGVQLVFAVPNALNQYRVDTFATKEPDTLVWIDGIPEASVLWDVGANVGLYTCYAAKARQCKVFAFEPSVFNLELLARNIFLNGLTDNATIVPLPLSSVLGINRLRMTSTEWGGALSTFGETFGYDGRPISVTFEVQTVGLSMNDARARLDVPQPDYIKMDVDGIEHLILAGGDGVMRNVRGILIEINENFAEQAENATRLLRAAGLRLHDKQQSPITSGSPFEATSNQIWLREAAP
jgi:FkbM family methyltransferase